MLLITGHARREWMLAILAEVKSRRWGAIYGEGYEHFCDRDLQDAVRFDDWPEIVLLDYVSQLAPWSHNWHAQRLFARRLHRRGAMMLVAGKLGCSHALNEEFILAEDLAYGRQGLPQIRVGGEARAVDVQHIVDTWECVHRRAAAVRNYIHNSTESFPRSWGSSRPTAVLVGEKPTRDGIFPFEGDDCSVYLTQLLNAAEIGERYIHLINAYDFDGAPLREAWIYHLNPKRVIGMGRIAQRLLRKLKVAHEEFPHPQYLRRFEHHKLAKRAAELRRLCDINGSVAYA